MSLADTVAVVTGATRGIGKGIAVGLGEAGATVYVTGRSTSERRGGLAGTVDETAAEVTELGGRGVAVQCDHRVDGEVEQLFTRIGEEEGRLDLLVNNAFATPAASVLWSGERFWEFPFHLWDDLLDVGLRSHFVAARYAFPLLLETEGLIINVASHASGRGKADTSNSILPYSVCKAGLHRMTSDMAVELRGTGVAVVAVWPPGTRTEGVLAQPEVFPDITNWKAPAFTGRVVAALVADGQAHRRSGEALVIADLAEVYGIAP